MKKSYKKDYIIVLLVMLLVMLVSCGHDQQNVQEVILPNGEDENSEIIIEPTDISSFDKLDLSDIEEYKETSLFYKDGELIDIDDVDLDEEVLYSDEDNDLSITKVTLAPTRFSPYYKAGTITFEGLLAKLKVDELPNEVSALVSKHILINTELNVEIMETKVSTLNDEDAISIWFSPICYEIKYKDQTYRVLKTANNIENSDGILIFSNSPIIE